MDARVLTVLALATGLSMSGCSEYRYIATDGDQVYGGTVFDNKVASWVVVKSAKHDIPCASPALLGEGSFDREWVVEGCGQRLTYRFFAWAGHSWQPALVSRVSTCGSPHPPADEPCIDSSAQSAR
jgi:hypothetical protein